VAILGVAFWRSAANLHGHVRAGAQVIVAALAAQAGRVDRLPDDQMPNDVTRLLPGFGSLVAVRLDPGNGAIGQTLAQLNLRGLTGATVLGITRREGEVLIPSALERLRTGDVLALAGTHDAIEAAKLLLRG
jgi:CPA2 family monovalent cation:H+ antiporter-2